jgi:hypothetical protein
MKMHFLPKRNILFAKMGQDLYWLPGLSDNEASSAVTNRATERALERREA